MFCEGTRIYAALSLVPVDIACLRLSNLFFCYRTIMDFGPKKPVVMLILEHHASVLEVGVFDSFNL